jgi:hypothetical protein
MFRVLMPYEARKYNVQQDAELLNFIAGGT